MDKLKNMQVFVYAAQNGSFAKAAAHFSVSSTMIGKHVKSLEEQLGIKLLNRTTRKQSLTEAGQIYLRECERILSDIADAENSLQTLKNKPKGTVRINSPVTYGNLVLAPLVADFFYNCIPILILNWWSIMRGSIRCMRGSISYLGWGS